MLARSCIYHEWSFIIEDAVALAASTQANEAMISYITAFSAFVLGLCLRKEGFGLALRPLVDLLTRDTFQG